jgi:phage terminase large subunit
MNRIKVFEDCKETFKEFAGYVWDEKQDEDKPIKVDDHLMDSIRYFVRTKRIYKPTKEYTSAFERRRF